MAATDIRGVDGGTPLCSSLLDKEIVLGFDDGSQAKCSSHLLVQETARKRPSDLRVTSIIKGPKYASFGSDSRKIWGTVAVENKKGFYWVGDTKGRVHLCDAEDGVVKSQKVHRLSISGLASYDHLLVTAALDGFIKLWHILDSNQLKQVGEFGTAAGTPITCVKAFKSMNENNCIAAADRSGKVYVITIV